jgi:hypothetical protein
VSGSHEIRITGGSTVSGNFVAGDVSGVVSNYTNSPQDAVDLAALHDQIQELIGNLADLSEWREIIEVEATLAAHLDDPSSVGDDRLRDKMSKALPVLRQLTIGAAGSSLATEVYGLMGRYVAG